MPGKIVESGAAELAIGAIANTDKVCRSSTSLVSEPIAYLYLWDDSTLDCTATGNWYHYHFKNAAVFKVGFTHSEGGASPEQITVDGSGYYLITVSYCCLTGNFYIVHVTDDGTEIPGSQLPAYRAGKQQACVTFFAYIEAGSVIVVEFGAATAGGDIVPEDTGLGDGKAVSLTMVKIF